MDIKEIAERVSKRIYVEDGLLLSKFISEKFAEAIISAYKAELLKEAGEPFGFYYEINGTWDAFVVGETEPDDDVYDEGSLKALFTSDQVAAAVLKATKPLEEEVERLKGIKNVQLDIYPNDAGTKQQREVDGSLEMGQLLADSKNEETGNPKAERAKSLVWMHTGGGHIADSSGKRIGIFSGDFKHRDRLICAVNSESDLLAQLAAAQEEGATVTSERDNLWFKLETAKAELADLRDQLAKTEQRVAEYNELIYAVQTKNPDETRHQTALRYIRNAENRPSNATANGASS